MDKAAYEAQYNQDADLVGDVAGDWVLNSFDIDGFIYAVSNHVLSPIPVRLLAAGQTPSAAQGETRIKAEADCDGEVTGFDIGAFVLALTDPEGYAQQYPDCDPLNGDMDGDGQLTGFDVDLFTQHLAGCTVGCTGMRAEYLWNAENRLTAVVPVAPQAGDKKVEFAYDHLGRRVEKKVYDWDDQTEQWEATPSLHRKFLWSGWLLLLELDCGTGVPPVETVVRRYTWGLDLAGQNGAVAAGLRTGRDAGHGGPALQAGRDAGHGGPALQGAGGIGGLPAVDQAAIDYPDPTSGPTMLGTSRRRLPNTGPCCRPKGLRTLNEIRKNRKTPS